jgi:hypothetical protein
MLTSGTDRGTRATTGEFHHAAEHPHPRPAQPRRGLDDELRP